MDDGVSQRNVVPPVGVTTADDRRRRNPSLEKMAQDVVVAVVEATIRQRQPPQRIINVGIHLSERGRGGGKGERQEGKQGVEGGGTEKIRVWLKVSE